MFQEGRNKGLMEAARLTYSWAYGGRLDQSVEDKFHNLAEAIRELQR